MSVNITDNMVQQFGANFRILGQQMKSRLQPFCQIESGIVGTSKSVERLGAADAYDLATRRGDTQFVDVPHSRRWLDLSDKAWAELVDEMDKIKMLADPTSPYVRIGNAALMRKRDDVIIANALGTARTATGTLALPSAQKITSSAQGLTLAKLLSVKEIFDASEIDTDDMNGQSAPQRVFVVTTRQLTNLLGTTEIKNVDYNSVKALAQGQVDTFLNFKFIRCERLPKSGVTRSCLAFINGCMTFGMGMDVVTTISPRPDKNESVQVYARESIGAVRTEDAGVVQCDCDE